ncbi:MAG: 3-methyl-2-oxobutanoate hydroxymethyltransferase [Deltaproteobacteria bacterium]|nr:3-methyl-2-oxobutanoate hydroxymethyltransferase [Deltaproteobacteria bacterium]
MTKEPSLQRVTVPEIFKRKGHPSKITALTAYDYTVARIVDAAGVDVVLVGDSLGTVVQGLETTLPVTLEEMIYHARCVARGLKRALLVSDLPFLSYQPSSERAIEAAGRMLKEGGAAAVKLEGGLAVGGIIAAITSFDIPVMGHVGLTPQSFHRMGGHKIQGRQSAGNGKCLPGSRERVIEDALAVEEAGAFAVVIEGVPHDLAAEITEKLSIPTIGIGAGPHCDGQILVTHDLLGLSAKVPGFVKRRADLGVLAEEALRSYVEEVRGGV